MYTRTVLIDICFPLLAVFLRACTCFGVCATLVTPTEQLQLLLPTTCSACVGGVLCSKQCSKVSTYFSGLSL